MPVGQRNVTIAHLSYCLKKNCYFYVDSTCIIYIPICTTLWFRPEDLQPGHMCHTWKMFDKDSAYLTANRASYFKPFVFH